MIPKNISDSLFDNFLKVFVVGSMVFFMPQTIAYVPQEIFVQHCAMVLLGLSLFIPPKRNVSNIYLALIFFYAIGTTLFHFNPVSRMATVNLFLGILALKIIADRVTFDFKKMSIPLLGFVILNIGLLVLQYFDRDPIFGMVHPENKTQIEMVGFMASHYALGVLGAFSLPFLYSLNPYVVIFCIPLLFFGKSSTAIGAAVITFLFLLWFEKKRLVPKSFDRWITNKRLFYFFAFVSILAAGYYIIFIDAPSGQFHKRLEIWWAAIAVGKMHPWFGFGLGQWAAVGFTGIQENGVPETWIWAHCEFIQYLFEQGVVGAVLLYAYFKNLLRGFSFKKENARIIFSTFIVLCIVSAFHFPFHARFPSMVIFILALMEAWKHDCAKTSCGGKRIA